MDGMIRFALGSAYLSNIMISIKSNGNVKIIIDYCNRKSITGEIIKSFLRGFYFSPKCTKLGIQTKIGPLITIMMSFGTYDVIMKCYEKS